jgi:chromosome partitioning protein
MMASFVITQCPSLPNQAGRILEAKEVCSSFGINVLNAVTFNRNIYDDSEEQGSSVIEIDPKGKAAAEMIAIAEELMSMKPDNAHEFN